MKRRSHSRLVAVVLAVAGCGSLDAGDVVVPDISGTYVTTIALTLANEFETRSDTLPATLRLRRGAAPGEFVGSYAIAPTDSGPFGGLVMADSTLWLMTFGATYRPLGGVSRIRALYWWCDFSRLGSPLIRGALAGDTLDASVQGSLPCLYQMGGGTLTIHTELRMQLTGVRGLASP
ncbi:MAG: hypothetical protein DMD54_01100 [Gemmatimonadetes bacterium]|nr:MAG: hypothetical protein DMD54_01100 [Gemmatimonadota bacterium]